nr:hypothetical protein [Candidatus Baldrarchaeota archaeon]
MIFGFMCFEDFIKWYSEIGKLKVFWAKIVRSVDLLGEENGLTLINVKWIVRKKVKEAILAIVERRQKILKAMELFSKHGDATRILVVPENLTVNLNLVNARSILYFWKIDGKTLEPDKNVRIEVCREWSEDELEIFRSIHKKSWGFFVPPRPEDHVVILGYLNDVQVAMAYLNIHNFNIDYGIHVVKAYWRRRIGTKLLVEILKLAKTMNAHNVSVVRIFRSIRGTSSDIRAAKFYKANNPLIRLSIYRIAVESSEELRKILI